MLGERWRGNTELTVPAIGSCRKVPRKRHEPVVSQCLFNIANRRFYQIGLVDLYLDMGESDPKQGLLRAEFDCPLIGWERFAQPTVLKQNLTAQFVKIRIFWRLLDQSVNRC